MRSLLAGLLIALLPTAIPDLHFASSCFGQPGNEPAARAAAKPRLTVATTRFGVVNLMDLDLDGKDATQRTEDAVGADEPAWSPDGSQLAYVSYKTGRRQIYVTPADGSEERQLTHSSREARNPGWTADGKRIVFADDREGVQDVFAINADGTNEVNLTRHASTDADPAWSPDGKRIVFGSDRTPNRVFRLFVMDADGSNQQELVPNNLVGWVYPAWSPDGKQIAFGGPGANLTIQLFVVNTDGSGLQQLTFGALSNSWPAWSPDGQYIAYIEFDASLAANAKNQNPPKGDLRIYDTINDVHTEISTGDISISGPRASWHPSPTTAVVKPQEARSPAE